MESETGRIALQQHIERCAQCRASQKRVNDFCLTGRTLFAGWNAPATGMKVLGEGESRSVIAQYESERRKARKNFGKQHLHRYLSEFDFRYNSRDVKDGERTVMAIKQTGGKRLMLRDSRPQADNF